MKTVAGSERRRYKPPRRRRGTVEDGGGGILHEQRNGVSIKTPPSKPSVLSPNSCGAQNILRHNALNILTAAPNPAHLIVHRTRFAGFAPVRGAKRSAFLGYGRTHRFAPTTFLITQRACKICQFSVGRGSLKGLLRTSCSGHPPPP